MKQIGLRLFIAWLSLSLVSSLYPFNSRSAQAVSLNIAISEFRVRGPNGGNDEFIELYNLSTSPVNIGGWKINGSNSSGATTTRATINPGITLNSGCHYLLTNSSPTGGPYSGAVAGDQTYGTGITDDGEIALLTSSDVNVDQVGMSSGSVYKEGTNLPNLGTTNLNRGYERKPGGASGSGIDTDNNATDFQSISPSDPQNVSSACVDLGGPDLCSWHLRHHPPRRRHGCSTGRQSLGILQRAGEYVWELVQLILYIIGEPLCFRRWRSGQLPIESRCKLRLWGDMLSHHLCQPGDRYRHQ